MIARGITHCYYCYRPLKDNEGFCCKNCEERNKKDQEDLEDYLINRENSIEITINFK